MTRKLLLYKISFYIILILLSCKRENVCVNCNINNKPPIAYAGKDTVIQLPLDSVGLDGTGSSDQDGKISSWKWSKVSGPSSFFIARTSDSTTKVKGLVEGTYVFELTIKDNGGLSAKDSINVIVNAANANNLPPTANAGSDQLIILPMDTTNLDGRNSRDPENSIAGYLWKQLSGPSTSVIVNASIAQTDVMNLKEGVYEFELKVTDSESQIGIDTVKLIVYQKSEIIYTDLVWFYWHDANDPSHTFDEISVWVEDSTNSIPDVLNPLLEVWVKRSPDSKWEWATGTLSNGLCTAPFLYKLSPTGLTIYPCSPWDLGLNDKKAEVKIRY